MLPMVSNPTEQKAEYLNTMYQKKTSGKLSSIIQTFKKRRNAKLHPFSSVTDSYNCCIHLQSNKVMTKSPTCTNLVVLKSIKSNVAFKNIKSIPSAKVNILRVKGTASELIHIPIRFLISSELD